MYRLYDYLSSGNSYKVRLLLAMQGIAYERIDVDIIKGESRNDEFMRRNPNGRVPTLDLGDGRYLWESNAILYFLAAGSRWLPDDRLQQAQVLQWMFFEQYSHEPYIAVARFWLMHVQMDEQRKTQLKQKMDGGYAALAVMEKHLDSRDWFVGDAASIADIALYAYTHVADEGGFDLAPYPAVRAWLDRFAALPAYIAITVTPD